MMTSNVSLIVVLLFLIIQQNDALFNLYAYTSDLKIMSNDQIYCHNETTCYNLCNHLMNLNNTKYVCFYRNNELDIS